MDLQRVGRGIDCIDLAHERDRWRVVLKAVMKVRAT
jgi:hypothetical protein